MKKMLLGALCLLLTYCPSYGQLPVPLDSSFYKYLGFFYTNNQDDSTEGGMYNHVRRAEMTWGPRLYPSGNMTDANKAIIKYSKGYNQIPTTALTTSSIQFPANHPNATGWNESGPMNLSTGIGNGRGMGQIHRIAFHPAYGTFVGGVLNQTMYAGSHYGGLYRSDNAGQDWYNFDTDQGLPITSVGGIAVSNDKVFVCTGNGDNGFSFGYKANYEPLKSQLNSNPLHTQGVYYYGINSTNEWTAINGATTLIDNTTTTGSLLDLFENGGTMRNIIVHPGNDDILLIATSQGIFRTDDRGLNWKQVWIGPDPFTLDSDWRGLEFHPTSPNIVYASGRDIYKSINGGLTWTSMTNGLNDLALNTHATDFQVARINITTTPNITAIDRVYAQIVGDYEIAPNTRRAARMLYVYDGTNWVFKKFLPSNTYNGSGNPSWIAMAVSPIDINLAFIGMLEIGKFNNFEGTNPVIINASGSGGLNFTSVNHNLQIHDDVHAIEFPPNNIGTEMFIGTHGGVSRYDLTTNTWQALYNGLGVATIWSFDEWEGRDGLIAIAKQDAGIDYTVDNGLSWRSGAITGDGYGVQIDDHSGLAFFLTNGYNGVRTIYPGLTQPQEVSPFVPIDQQEGNPSWVPNTFKVINHPKTDELYFGLTELYTRNYLTLVEQNAAGGSNPWTIKSNIGTFPNKQGQWSRQIMEVAFSEDYLTDNTYLSTLNYTDPSPTPNIGNSFRSGFYFSAQSNCATCFVDKTGFLPISTNTSIPAHVAEPNPLTGIAVDPRNGNRVWVSFTGFDPAIKVFYSDQAGDAGTWQNYDPNGTLAGLNMPVNGIVYQRGTDDRLYIATDVGVYVRDAGGDWLRFDNAANPFPNVRVTELKINYCSGKLRAATFGRGVWEADLLPPSEDESYRSFRLITSNEVWSTNKNMSRDIRVRTGSTLTLNNGMILNMPKGGLIIVEQGAQLIVDNATITNLCGQTWQGIQVWGNTALAQTPTNQGLITLNDATIEYAKNAISPWQVGNFPNPAGTSGGTGGIIRATNSLFKNNWRSADFMQYVNRIFISPTNTIPVSEKSFFRDCTFTVDDFYRSFNGVDNFFLGHISMWGVGGTQIQGCTFQDMRTNKTGDQNTGGSYGVFTLGASPAIGALSLGNTFPPTLFDRTQFEGIERGVDIGNPGPFLRAGIDQCDFVGCEQGVTIRAHDMARITRNTFQIGAFDVQDNTPSFVEEYGLGIIATPNYVVQQNSFTGTTTDERIGSWVDNTLSAPNTIRKNSYNNLSCGNIAHGANAADLNNPTGGLQYPCNSNQNNEADFGIVTYTANFAAAATISAEQGANSQPIKNTFTPTPAFGNFMHFGPQNVQYFFENGALNEDPTISTLNILRIGTNQSGSGIFCIDNFTNPSTTSVSINLSGPQSPNQFINQLKSNYYDAAHDYDIILKKYQKLLDNGNSDSLKVVVKNTTPQNKNTLKDSLMSISPYLTKECLLEVVDCGLFNKNQLKAILMENPNVLLDSLFLDTLSKMNTPLNAKDLQDIKESPRDQLKEPKKTFKRTKLESELALAYQAMFFLANEIIFEHSNDTAGANFDSLKTWIQKKPGVEAQYELVELYWQQKQYQNALDLLNTIPNNYKLEKLGLINHNLFVDFKKLLLKAYQQDRSEATLERQEVIDLNVIAAQKAGFASVQAANILQFFYGIKYAYYPALPKPGAARSSWIDTTSTEELTVSTQLWGYPNPAINWMDLQYNISSDVDATSSNQLIITSTAGQVIESIELQGNSGVVQLNTTDWAGGIYFAVLFSNKTKNAVYKFVVRK